MDIKQKQTISENGTAPETDIHWLGKPYYSLDAYCKNTYGQKLYKIALNAGLTCPNRDGTLDSRGCIFCSAGGSGDFAVNMKSVPSIGAQLEENKPAAAILLIFRHTPIHTAPFPIFAKSTKKLYRRSRLPVSLLLPDRIVLMTVY